jgi:hypothetical protein
MDPRMMRQWLAAQTKKTQITEAQMQRKRLGINEEQVPKFLQQPAPRLVDIEYKDGVPPLLDRNKNIIGTKPDEGEYVGGRGPLSPEVLDDTEPRVKKKPPQRTMTQYGPGGKVVGTFRVDDYTK